MRPFMPHPPVTFTAKLGPVLTDAQLLRAWSHLTTAQIKAIDDHLPLDPKARTEAMRCAAIRAHVLTLREARKAAA